MNLENIMINQIFSWSIPNWFVKSENFDYIRIIKLFKELIICLCLVNKTCINPNLSCNCDFTGNGDKWLSDEGYYETPDSLGITGMVFLQQRDLEEDAQGRITLGPLECVETSK